MKVACTSTSISSACPLAPLSCAGSVVVIPGAYIDNVRDTN
jgi:hypothetical protein